MKKKTSFPKSRNFNTNKGGCSLSIYNYQKYCFIPEQNKHFNKAIYI